jgi:saccharopine dehydrogenase (NADP+, L-glutamate forming)
MKNILVLGAGLVARPLIRYLLAQPQTRVTVASVDVPKALAMIAGHARGEAVELDVQQNSELDKHVAGADIVISLVPYQFHVQVAEICLLHKVNFISASYVSPAMKALDEQARQVGIVLLNEIGLDPGIDHMSATKIIDDVHSRGGRIIRFESCCGGLPAPESNDNPFGFKFSWSPRGVLMAGRNPAHYLKDGTEIFIDGQDLFKHHWLKHVAGLGTMEVYPNRDSLLYKELYHLEYVKTLFRGTFRNPGWCETMEKIVQLGFLDNTARPDITGKTVREITAMLIQRTADENVEKYAAKYLHIHLDSLIMRRLEWLGLLDNDPVQAGPAALLDILVQKMVEKMSYQPNERDMVVLQHDFTAEYRDGAQEKISSLLVDYGNSDGDSSMSRTVGLPAAIAAKLILQGKVKLTGVHIPVIPQLYLPVLAELQQMGIKFKETVTRD